MGEWFLEQGADAGMSFCAARLNRLRGGQQRLLPGDGAPLLSDPTRRRRLWSMEPERPDSVLLRARWALILKGSNGSNYTRRLASWLILCFHCGGDSERARGARGKLRMRTLFVFCAVALGMSCDASATELGLASFYGAQGLNRGASQPTDGIAGQGPQSRQRPVRDRQDRRFGGRSSTAG